MAGDFKTTTVISLSLSSYFIGFALGQILYGPLLDRFGRKRPLYFGLILYIMASIGCAQAHSIHALIALRLIQALGGCAAQVAAIANGARFLSRKGERQSTLPVFPHHRSFTAARAHHWQRSGLRP
jgi:DHA1 family bicyclomycin/chloramphenicol resistance-like MFS transporter